MTPSPRYRIWMLLLVPPGRFGRWWSALILLVAGALLFGAAGLQIVQHPAYDGQFPWSIPVFFTCAVAYIVPMFHFITMRTHQCLDTLESYVPSVQRRAELRAAIDRRSLAWTLRSAGAAVVLWLVQSRLLSGSWDNVWTGLTANFASSVFAFGPLFVWLTMYVAMSALVQNALTYRRLVPELATDIFEPASYMPVGSMAVTSTLVSLGGMALMSIMWLGGPIDWWTTLPGLVIFAPFVVLLLLLPVVPLHRKLLGQRKAAVEDAQRMLRRARESKVHDDASMMRQSAALSLHRDVARLPVWPFDMGAVTRFIAYAVIVPLTWAGAALIEMLVNALVEAG